MEKIQFDGFSIPVTNVNRSVAFYQLIGFSVVQTGDHFAMLQMGSGTIGLLYVKSLDEWPIQLRRNVHIELSTDNLDALYVELQELGIEFYLPPKDNKWERAMATLDPDGYKVEFAQGIRGQNQTALDE